MKRSEERTKRSLMWGEICLCCFNYLMVLPFSTVFGSGVPHTVSGTVSYQQGGFPDSVIFSAYNQFRPDEILTENSSGCGYMDGYYWVQCANFTTSWQAGDMFSIQLQDLSIGFAADTVMLTNDSNDSLHLIIENSDQSLPVFLISFTATPEDNRIVLCWNTASEVNHLGFYLYRAIHKNGPFSLITPLIIKDCEENMTSSGERSYIYADINVSSGTNYWYRLESIDINGHARNCGEICVSSLPQNLPQKVVLFCNYPNPFNPETTFSYQLSEDGYVTIEVYNGRGNRIRTLVSSFKKMGVHQVIWDGKDKMGNRVPSGTYFAVIVCPNYQTVTKCVFLK